MTRARFSKKKNYKPECKCKLVLPNASSILLSGEWGGGVSLNNLAIFRFVNFLINSLAILGSRMGGGKGKKMEVFFFKVTVIYKQYFF